MKPTDRLLANPRFRKALGAILALAKADEGMPPLAEPLTALVYAALMDKKARRYEWEKWWSTGTKKTWKNLTDFPRRLRNMADEIEAVSKGPSFDPELWITARTTQAETVKRRFRQLPGVLKVYAAFIEQQLRRVPHGFAPYRQKGQFLPMLSQVVRRVTGRFCDREVAELLNAASIALGQDHREWDALSLAQARSRQHKSKAT